MESYRSVSMFEILTKHKEYESEILRLYLRQAVFFKHFILLGVYDLCHTGVNNIETAPFIPLFLFFR